MKRHLKFLTVLLLASSILLSVIPISYAQKAQAKRFYYSTPSEYTKVTGKKIAKYNEAPELSELVRQGKLLAVERRLPDEPLIVEPLEGIGKYGGVYRGAGFGPISGQVDTETLRVQNILQINPDLKTITPNIVKTWGISKDFKEVTLILRRGMKWSDGQPFTADDFMFWYEDIANNNELTPVKNTAWTPGGKMMEMRKINPYTIKIKFAAPYPAVDITLAKSYIYGRFFAPKHYLKQYHIKYNPQANDIAKKEGFASWVQCFQYHLAYAQDQMDTKLPDITPWVLTRIDESGNKYYDRNLYYWKVDTAGNQLPYINGQVVVLVKDAQVRIMKLISQELHAAGENPLLVKEYTLYKENEKKGDYTVYLFNNTRGSDWCVAFNLTHKDPVLRKIFNDIKFRQAMSLAIDRKQINDVLYYGKADIRQAVPPPETSFYEDWMGKYFIEYDPDRANKILDEIGLKWDKDKKVRLRPDGKPLEVVLECTEEFAPQSEMVSEMWTKIGVKTIMKQEERTLFYERGTANERDVAAWTFDGVAEFSLRSGGLDGSAGRRAFGNPINAAPLWTMWITTKGASGEEPPELIKRFYETGDKFLVTSPKSKDYKKLGGELLKISTENLWAIGTSVSPRVIMISNKLGNTPKEGTFAYDYHFWVPYMGDTWYFKR
ncbi:TPA: ABC transporter substrate-binding protein [bacterium]|nr:ABC transporter substrate-binding protein [bacterium]